MSKKIDNNNNKTRFLFLKISLKVIKPDKNIKSSVWQFCLGVAFGAFFAIALSINKDTVTLFRECLDFINGIFIAFIAMELGAYAIFQALLKNRLVYELFKADDLLKKSNESFLGVILLFWFCIMVNIVLILTFMIVPNQWVLSENFAVNIGVSIVLLFLYFSFQFRVLFEIRNFAINLYKIFEAHNKISILDYLDEKQKKV